MTDLLEQRTLEILSYACALAIGAVIGWFSRRPIVAMPERDEHGKFLPWKKKETA